MGDEGERGGDKVNKMKLTAIIIVSPDSDRSGLERTVRSVGFADEVLVEEIKTPIKDFAKVRNEVLSRAKNDWVFFLDADEEVSEELKEEIKKVTGNSYKDYKNYNISGYYFRRRDRFLGRWLGHGETASVRLLRLARKDAGRWERPVHEVWKVGGRTGEFKNPIWHYSHESVDGMVEKLDRYSEIEAEYRFYKTNKLTKEQTNKKTNKSLDNKIIKTWLLVEMAVFPMGEFVVNYFWRLGVLDGMGGFIHAGMMSGHSLLVRTKMLWRMDAN